MNNILLFLTGMSHSGKDWFQNNKVMPLGAFYRLVSLTSRDMRSNEGESPGNPYHFVKTADFRKQPMATCLFTNEKDWRPGKRKYLYGLTEREILPRIGQNLLYNVNEPRYARDLIDWFKSRDIKNYDFKIIRFAKIENDEALRSRENYNARKFNTADDEDFARAGLRPDWDVTSSAAAVNYPATMIEWFNCVAERMFCGDGPTPKFDLQGLVFNKKLNCWTL